jgi:hypothetical protein
LTKKRNKKVKKILSFSPRHGFFFPAHNPEYPQKTVPANAGPQNFRAFPAFRLPANQEPSIKTRTLSYSHCAQNN